MVTTTVVDIAVATMAADIITARATGMAAAIGAIAADIFTIVAFMQVYIIRALVLA